MQHAIAAHCRAVRPRLIRSNCVRFTPDTAVVLSTRVSAGWRVGGGFAHSGAFPHSNHVTPPADLFPVTCGLFRSLADLRHVICTPANVLPLTNMVSGYMRSRCIGTKGPRLVAAFFARLRGGPLVCGGAGLVSRVSRRRVRGLGGGVEYRSPCRLRSVTDRRREDRNSFFGAWRRLCWGCRA